MQKPQKKNRQTKVESFVNKAVNWAAVENGLYAEFDFGDFGYEGEITEEEITDFEKNITEVAVFNAIKKNKKIQKCVDRMISDLTEDLFNSIRDVKRNIEADKKYEAQRRKYEEERKAKEEKEAKVRKMESAQRAVFLEGLTGEQKKAFKKFYKINI